jgi:CRISPR-associated protein Csx17
LLDAIVAALDRIDRNRRFREGKIRWQPLPLAWLPSLFADERPGVEVRLALSLVSSFPMHRPFATYRFGVEWNQGKGSAAGYTHPERPPSSWVWGPGDLARVLGTVLARKLLDQESDTDESGPGERTPLAATGAQVRRWLDGDVDETLLSAWISRLALFDWRFVSREVLAFVRREEAGRLETDGDLALFGLFQPLVDQRSLVVPDLSPNDLLAEETGARTTAAARSLVTLIRTGSLDGALRLASSRYAMAGARLAMVDAPFAVRDSDRLAAALLFAVSDPDRVSLFERWLRPRRRPQRGEANA